MRHACNYLGSREIGRKVGELVKEAIAGEGYNLIPDAEKPVLISLKGASAAGKSSLRPMLREMMAQLGFEDQGYGTISPDIWRRLLLDYDALGESYKYAGRFTSHEVNIIDTKLDHYIRAKAEQRRAEAVAAEQEYKAHVAENRARLVMAEAEVPRAMADAFRKGRINVSQTA